MKKSRIRMFSTENDQSGEIKIPEEGRDPSELQKDPENPGQVIEEGKQAAKKEGEEGAKEESQRQQEITSIEGEEPPASTDTGDAGVQEDTQPAPDEPSATNPDDTTSSEDNGVGEPAANDQSNESQEPDQLATQDDAENTDAGEGDGELQPSDDPVVSEDQPAEVTPAESQRITITLEAIIAQLDLGIQPAAEAIVQNTLSTIARKLGAATPGSAISIEAIDKASGQEFKGYAKSLLEVNTSKAKKA